jgi:aminoglycoside phosphotransferase (APT) family kinase protein
MEPDDASRSTSGDDNPGDSSPGDPVSPPGLDLDRLAAHLRSTRPGLLDGVLRAEVIAGGRSNLTYLVTGDTAAVVLRRPPLGHVLATAHDMTREYRVISALYPTGFPVPVPLYLCSDPDVIGEPFYLMSHVQGRVLRGTAELSALTPGQARRAGELLVDTLAALHQTDPAAVGLADFGRPEGFLQRQVRRWYGQWEQSKTAELPALDELASRLAATVPASATAAVVHGDYRLDNVMVDDEVSRILAVLDWEMATLGDPLTDVGLLVVYTDLAAEGLAPTLPRLGPEQGFAPSPQLVERYAERVPGAATHDLGWYVALGYYKLAIVSEGIHARYLMGKTVGEGFDQMGSSVPVLVRRASAALAGFVP